MTTTLENLWTRFTGWFRDVSAPIVQEVGLKPIDPMPSETMTVQRLQTGYVGTLVSCASCGVWHELEAVCHVCGAPLCWDEQNCRLVGEDPTLGLPAVYCPKCAG